ncbi:MAG TPA: response regulator [Pricia sp.]|nr:response regulator [Pricia sp.]
MTSILLIEDFTAIREGTAELLELEGYRVITAKNGKEGLEKIKRIPPDLVICDVRMPEMDGLTLLGNLGAHRDLKRIPFIFYSAKSEKRDIKTGLDAGADDYLVKPCELKELLGSIKKCLLKGKSTS